MPSDHQARLLAQREFSRPLVIEAGAGTGKTATLVARVLAWSLGPGWAQTEARLRTGGPPVDPPGRPGVASNGEALDAGHIAASLLRRVVAITFTEAAAAEMAERMTAGFAAVERGDRPVGFTALDAAPEAGAEPAARPSQEAIRRRAGALLEAVSQLQVRTIHSFCRKLLDEHAFAARLHPNLFVDADGATLREVVEETVEKKISSAYDNPGDANYLLLARHGHGPMEIADVVYDLAAAGTAPETFADDPFSSECRRDLLERLWQTCNRLLTLLETRRVTLTRARNASAMVSALGRLRRQLRRARRAGDFDVGELQNWLDATLSRPLTEHLRLWARGETANQAEKERLAGARDQLLPVAGALYRLRVHVGRLDPELLEAVRRVLAPLLRQVRSEMRARGALGFADLLREAHRLVVTRPRLVSRLRRRIDQLLVDEFQDTDRLQCGLICRLALCGPADERPGLFVVGDPKQSIYGWRSADLAAYEDFVSAVREKGGAHLVLDENFRSAPPILEEVERVIAPVMEHQAGLQPEFRPLRATARRAAPPSASVEHWISWLPDPEDPAAPLEGTARATHALEARAIAADLSARHQQGFAWSDMAVLLRSLNDVEAYLTALREARIPFVVSRDRQYYRRREIIDAAALVRTVLTPEDPLALLTCLRSVAVGVPDAALYPLWSAGLPRLLAALSRPDSEKLREIRDLGERVAKGVAGDIPGIEQIRGWQHNLTHTAWCLGELRRSFDEEPVDVFVDRLRRVTLFEATESARYLGVFRQANLERFFGELLRDLEEAAGGRHRLLRRLRTRIQGGHEAEEARPKEAAENAVQVLTIHKAKGLEFRCVYLPQLHKRAGQESVLGLEVGEREGRFEYRVFGAATLGFDLLAGHRDAVARAELVRTLYVAMTRAGERLVLLGRRPLDGTGAPVDRASAHMDLLLHRRGEAPSPSALFERFRNGVSHDDPSEEVAWILPGRILPPSAEPEEPDAAPDFPGVELPSLAEVRATRDRLRQCRVSAARRMERPWRQLASRLGHGLSEVEPAADRAPIEGSGAALSPPPEAALPGGERVAAMAAGSAIHKALETFVFEAEPAQEIARQRSRLRALVELFCEDDPRLALERAERLWDRFARGELGARFLELGGRILARELPVLLPPGGDDEAVGYLGGVVDLVYRDPAGGSLAIVDFKTDLIASEATITDLAHRYAAQGKLYVHALQGMLELDEPPRCELWFLDADRIETLRSQREDA